MAFIAIALNQDRFGAFFLGPQSKIIFQVEDILK